VDPKSTEFALRLPLAPAADAAQSAVQPTIHLPKLPVRLLPAFVRVRLHAVLLLNGRWCRLAKLRPIWRRRRLIRHLGPGSACYKKDGGSNTDMLIQG